DGEPWLNPPSIGCDEYYAGSVTGSLGVGISVPWTNLAPGFNLDCAALINGRTTALRWEFGDGTVTSNRIYTSHEWMIPGDYEIVLRAYNDSYPTGIAASLTIHVIEIVHYVALNSPNPVSPYTNWSTAATNIQNAVDAALVAGATVLVSNGVYSI